MIIEVHRDTYTANSVTSIIKLNGISYFVGLEPPNPLPAGEYEVWLRWSPKHNAWTPAVMNVPGHTDIEIHVGNFPGNTNDCLLVGMARGADVIEGSYTAYHKLLPALLACIPKERITIRYFDDYKELPSVNQANT